MVKVALITWLLQMIGKTCLAEMMGNTDDYDVFNVNEVGLFYKCASDKTMAFIKETCIGGKHNKERIMVLVSANMDGSEKLTFTCYR